MTLAAALSSVLREHPNILPDDMPEEIKNRLITPIFQTFNKAGTSMKDQGKQRLQLYFNDLAKELKDNLSLPEKTKDLVR